MKTKKNITTRNDGKNLDAYCADIEKRLKRFGELFTGALKELFEASCIYVEAVKKYGDAVEDQFKERYPQIGKKDWNMLAKIGSGTLSPKVFFFSSNYTAKMLGCVDIRQQEMLVGKVNEAEPEIEVVSNNSLVRKPLQQMNAVELATLIDTRGGKVRSVKEQIAAAAARLAAKQNSGAWEVKNGMLIVHRACTIANEELAELIALLSKCAK